MKYNLEELQEDCTEILRLLLCRYGFLHPESKTFDQWDNKDAAEVVADLIILIKKYESIDVAAFEADWGK